MWACPGIDRIGAEAKEEVDEIRSVRIAALAAAATITAATTAPPAAAHVAACDAAPSYTLCAIHHWRDLTWRYEHLVGAHRTRYGSTAERSSSAAYRRWVRHLWYTRALAWRTRFLAVEPPGVRAGLLCIHPLESVNWHLDGGLGPQVSGGLQIALGTWQANGGTRFAPAAYEAAPAEQLVVGAEIVRTSGWGAWPLTSVRCGL